MVKNGDEVLKRSLMTLAPLRVKSPETTVPANETRICARK